MFCENCGKEIKDGVSFCPYCGTPTAKKFVPNSDNYYTAPQGNAPVYGQPIQQMQQMQPVQQKNGFGTWYKDQWNRFINNTWSGAELMHHLLWLAGHIAALLIIIAIINGISNGISNHATAGNLTGSWADSSGDITITFERNGTVRVSDYTGTFGADSFKYKKVDGNTIKLKVNYDNFITDMLTINVDYEIHGNTLTLNIYGEELDLYRIK